MDETDGPFAGIIKHCITAADEEELRNSLFTVEFENFPKSFASQSLSLPVTDSVDRNTPHKNEKLRAPAEHQCSQTCISGSDDRRPANVSAGEDTAADYGDGKEAQVRVDLGKDSDNLGFSKPREITVNECHGGDGLERIDEVEYSEGDIDEPLRKRIRICGKNLGVQISIPQIVDDIEGEEIVRNEVVDDNRMKRNVDFAVAESKDGQNRVVHGKKHANGIKESCTAGGDGSIKGKRELPLWMKEGEKNGKAMQKRQFKDIIEVTMEVFGKTSGENKDADFFEAAKRRDMLFPRPRWWPHGAIC